MLKKNNLKYSDFTIYPRGTEVEERTECWSRNGSFVLICNSPPGGKGDLARRWRCPSVQNYGFRQTAEGKPGL